jgi:hypothetical protein
MNLSTAASLPGIDGILSGGRFLWSSIMFAFILNVFNAFYGFQSILILLRSLAHI